MSGRTAVYSDAVRAEGVRLIESGITYAEAARRVGASPGAVQHWHKQSRREMIADHQAPELSPLAPGTNIAGVIIIEALGRVVRPGVYAHFVARSQRQLDRVCYRVRCAVCGAGMAPVSHKRLLKLAEEYDVVNCARCRVVKKT